MITEKILLAYTAFFVLVVLAAGLIHEAYKCAP